MSRVFVAVAVVALLVGPSTHAVAPVAYRFRFPEPQHHWMQVDATFPELGSGPLELRVSRSSPGRYALHDFAKNIWDVHAIAADGSELSVARPDPSGWTVPNHGDAVTVHYKVFGDRVDGTYLAIDSTHAHINMPAAIVWARGLDDRPSTLTLVSPKGVQWQPVSQLHRGSSPFELTAPNLQYLMDSPVEFGPVSVRDFMVDGRKFRFSAHHTGTASDLEGFVKDVEKIVRQEGAIFGEYPAYEPGDYTFVADYLPYAFSDGMEHRNSTVMTSPGAIRTHRLELLDTVAHEFFHAWNVERIRPRSLEPFDFERPNMSAELWLAEGFTQYYGPVALSRAGFLDLASFAAEMDELVAATVLAPGRDVRSAEEMSRMAPFTDGGTANDRTNWPNTVISYYRYGGAIALALDLILRGRTEGRVSLDDYMRAMWRTHGKPGATREGYVDRPYTIADAEARLAEVSGDPSFARDFFARYVHGREVAEYAKLLLPAGLVLRRERPGRAWWGDVSLDHRGGGLRITSPPLANTPAYASGLDLDDEVRQIDGTRIDSAEDIQAVFRRHRPGDRVRVVYVDRTGRALTTSVTLAEDPELEIVPVETTGGTVNESQKQFRRHWLGAAK
ncbi:MAG: peptidase M61 [Acidobacteria bacterium]|nr:MAG: peptidase M61 [Acidobacteriota bacterium]